MRAVTTISINPTVLSEAQAKVKIQKTNLSRVVEQLLIEWAKIEIDESKNMQDQIDALTTHLRNLEQQKKDAEEAERKKKSRLIIMKGRDKNDPIF